MAKKDYKVTVGVNHNEKVMLANVDTGELTNVPHKGNNIPEGKELFEPNALFKKAYTVSWRYLEKELSAIEFKAAFSIALMAKANTNSLEPLSDDMTHKELAKILHVGKNKIDSILEKLFDYGVYGRFEVADKVRQHGRFWILNPYLAFSGKVIVSDIANLFRGTKIALNYFNHYRV